MHQPPYCAAADLTGLLLLSEAALIQLTDDAGLGVVDETKVAAAAEAAAIEIDSALVGRVALPLVSIPDAIRLIAGELTRRNLYADREAPAPVAAGADAALARLAALVAEPTRLWPPVGADNPPAAGIAWTTPAADPFDFALLGD
jgi:phage gp36-like protein